MSITSNSFLQEDCCPFCKKVVTSIQRHMNDSISCHMMAVLKTRNLKKFKRAKPTYQTPVSGCIQECSV